ncbi:MAG: ABC transporter permease [Gemmataceae bacterium]
MKKYAGLFVFLLIIYATLLAADPAARSAYNHFNLARRVGMEGIVCVGAGLLIITGGIDLSLGSVVGFSVALAVTLMRRDDYGWQPLPAMLVVILTGGLIGALNGFLVTKVRVQAFVVTLCGMFIYRGLTKWMTGDQVQGLSGQMQHVPAWDAWTRALYSSRDVWGLLKPVNYLLAHAGIEPIAIPVSLVLFLVVVVAAALFLHFSVYGRYFFAIGSNEQAARYSGVNTDLYKILAYVLCSMSAAVYGILHVMQAQSATPTQDGANLELKAIAGAVLGGCSVRGGEGNVIGIVIGTTILVLLPNLSLMLGIPDFMEFIVIGGALLIGAILDESLRSGQRVSPSLVLRVIRAIVSLGR